MPDILKLLANLKSVFITVLLGLSIYYLITLAHSKLGRSLPFKPTKKGIVHFLIFVLVVAVIYKILSAGGLIVDIIFIIFGSIILAYILNPLVGRIEGRKINRTLSIAIVYLGVIAFIAIAIMTIGPKIVSEITEFIQALPSYISDLYKLTRKFYMDHFKEINRMAKALNIESPESMASSTLSTVREYLTDWTMALANNLSVFFGKVFNLVLVPIITFYFLKDKDKFKDLLIKAIPWKKRDEVVGVFRDIDAVMGSFIRGQLIVCAFIGIATAIALTIIGIDFSILIGIFAGIFNIVPYLGPIIGLVPAVILALIDDPIKVVWVVIAITVIQQIESNFITPKIVGDSVGIHPIAVMLAVLLSGSYFGLFGMLLAIPAVATARILYRFFRDKIRGMKDGYIFPDDERETDF